MYSHDTYGLGHLRRTLAIAGFLAKSIPHLNTLILTGSPVAHNFVLPARTDYVKLPSVVKTGEGQYHARSLNLTPEDTVGLRATLIRDAALHFAPDVVLVDHAPTGMKGEALPALRALRNELPRTRIALGLRDILDEPDKVRRDWDQANVYGSIFELYDRILVYGQRDVFNTIDEYAFPAPLAARTAFTGYIRRDDPLHLPAVLRDELGLTGADFVLVTAGGGGDGAELHSISLEALAMLRQERSELQAVVVTGPLMDAEEHARLEMLASSMKDTVHMIPFHRDIPGLMRAASLVVSMGGYNSVCEILASGTPGVVVPRTHPRLEQHIRAVAFARLGLLDMVPSSGLTAKILAQAILHRLGAAHSDDSRHGTWNHQGLQHISAEVAAMLLSATEPTRRAS
jgi:predicted glycosyltransferase